MVDRRRLSRLRTKAQRGGVVVQLRTGKTEVFSEHTSPALRALEVEEGMEAEEDKLLAPSEPTSTPEREALALREALENVTVESRAQYEARVRRDVCVGGEFPIQRGSLRRLKRALKDAFYISIPQRPRAMGSTVTTAGVAPSEAIPLLLSSVKRRCLQRYEALRPPTKLKLV